MSTDFTRFHWRSAASSVPEEAKGTAGGAGISVRAVEGSAALRYLEGPWASVFGRDPAATPFASPAWLAGWAAQLSSSATPLVMVAEGSDGLGALALVREAADVALIKPLSDPYCEYVPMVGLGSQDAPVADALVRGLTGLAGTRTVVQLGGIPARSALDQAIARQPTWQRTMFSTAVVPLPFVTAPLPKSVRRQLARRERRLAASGFDLTYRRTRTPDELLAALPRLEALQRARWVAERRTLPASTDWGTVLRQGGRQAFIAEVELGGTPMAMQLCLVRGASCYSVLPAMNPELGALSPGHVLLSRLLADLGAAGLSAFDLGPTREDPGQRGYKAQYGPWWGSTVTAVLGRRGPHTCGRVP